MEQLYIWNATFAFLDSYKVLAKKNVFILQKNPNVSAEKIETSHLSGEGGMLHSWRDQKLDSRCGPQKAAV